MPFHPETKTTEEKSKRKCRQRPLVSEGDFEPVMNGTINQNVPQDASARKAAKEALNGYDPTGGCLYFYNPATAKSKWIWSRPIVKQIGKHNFAK